MRRRGAAAAACLAAAALTLAAATPASAAPTRLTIKITDAEVDLGEKTVIRGSLRNATPSASRRIFLLARKYPYKSERRIAGTYTGTGGTYFFRVRPSLNTRYRVAFEDVRSSGVRVYVFPVDKRTTVRTLSGNRAHAHFYFQFPKDYPLPLSGRKITWYFRKTTSNLYRTIATSRSRATKSRRMIGDVVFDLPDSRDPYRYLITWCYALGRRGQDIGVGRNAGGGCAKRFRVSDD